MFPGGRGGGVVLRDRPAAQVTFSVCTGNDVGGLGEGGGKRTNEWKGGGGVGVVVAGGGGGGV